ncbi:MAG: hypothetical protein EXR72_03180 [Myxococcales bacterium]|nr:hypothetical protein [Myxococcales bacterium]
MISLLTLAALLASAPAVAHEDRIPKRERLTLSSGSASLNIEYAVPRGDVARALAGIFDRDRSGDLEAGERALLGRHLAREATAFVALTVDGVTVVLLPGAAPTVTVGGRDGPLLIVCDLAATVALTPGAHRVVLSDRHKDRRVVIPVEVHLGDRLTWRARPAPLPSVDAAHPLDLAIAVD